MLKQLITDKRNLSKHLAVPLLKEREAYLESLSQKGLARSTLQIRAIYLPHIIRLLKLIDGTSKECVSLVDIDAAAEKWSTSSHTGKPRISPSTKKLFTQIAIEWLIHINRMDKRYTRTIIACGNLQDSGTIRKYYEYPFFEERISYLEHMRAEGFKPYVIRRTAIYQLHAIDFLHLTTLRKVEHYEIEAAAYAWNNTNTTAKNKVIGRILAFNGFKWHTINWLKHLKLYEAPAECIPWKDILISYLDYITELGGSNATRTMRYYMIRKFLCFLEAKGSSPQKLTLSLIDEYINELSKNDKRNRVTCANVATGLRSFVNYLEQMQWCPQGLGMGIRQPRRYKLGELPSSPEWNVVKDIVISKDTDLPTDIRNHAILMLFSVYSLRCSEVINLKLKDLDWRAETIQFIRAKNGKPQVFPLKKEVGDAIIRYIRKVRPNQAGSGYVFLCMRAPYRKLSCGAIYNFVSAEFKNRGVELEHYGPHAIRKAGATHMINNGVSLKTISAHLGHQQLDTTRIYAKVDLVNLRKVADIDWKGVLT